MSNPIDTETDPLATVPAEEQQRILAAADRAANAQPMIAPSVHRDTIRREVAAWHAAHPVAEPHVIKDGKADRPGSGLYGRLTGEELQAARAATPETLTREQARSGIYIASKSKHGPRWVALRDTGIPIISTWIDESGEGQTSDWQDLWDRCIREASTAAAFVMYVEPGEVHKGSLAELGAALHAGVPVFWVGPEVGSVRRARRVTICSTIEEAMGRAIGCAVHSEAMRDPEFAALLRASRGEAPPAPQGTATASPTTSSAPLPLAPAGHVSIPRAALSRLVDATARDASVRDAREAAEHVLHLDLLRHEPARHDAEAARAAAIVAPHDRYLHDGPRETCPLPSCATPDPPADPDPLSALPGSGR